MGKFLLDCIFRTGGVNIPGEDDNWDFGSGAGFYVNATQEPWKKHYQMYSYVTKELPEIINKNFPVIPDQQSIMGHRWVLKKKASLFYSLSVRFPHTTKQKYL